MGGYIILTTQEWINSLQQMGVASAVFWRKKHSFKAIDKGEPIYFLRRGAFTSNENRFLVGKGIYIGHKVMNENDAWEYYGEKLGFAEESSFISSVHKMYKEDNALLGCLLMEQLEFYRTAVSLKAAGIEFSPYTVSGKKITAEECSRIDYLSGGKNEI